MAAGLTDAIRALVSDRGISEELIQRTIEEFLIAAYKKKYGQADNAVVLFSEDGDDVTLYARKKIVEELEDPKTEIEIDEAKERNEEAELGDELLIEINPMEFDRVAVQSAKQKAKQTLREIQKDTLYSEFKDKVGELIIGYYQRERNGNIFVDLGKTEGLMPKRYQSPREIYRPNDRIKALIYEVSKSNTGLQIILSRTHTEFVKRIFEIEVPEVYDGTVEIFKLVREPGYRTKIAVLSNREDVDPVGACVGLRGVRIQAIVRELEGEKIDILKYETDPRLFIKNALSPAEVSNVLILDDAKRQALAIVPENQLSLAIGKQGLNVRLANRLADWSIDVKTEAQFEEMDIAATSRRAVSELFGELVEEEEITEVRELPGVPISIINVLSANGIELIEHLVSLTDDELRKLDGMTEGQIAELKQIIAENIEIVEGMEDELDAEEAAGEKERDRDELTEEDESQAAEEDLVETGMDEAADLAEEEAQEEPLGAISELAPSEDETSEEETSEEDEVITSIAELPSIPEHIVTLLTEQGIEDIVELLNMEEEELRQVPGLSEEDVATIRTIIEETVEIVSEEDEEE